MRLLTVAILLTSLPWAAFAAPTWQTISSEPGKRIELDRTSLKREEGGKVQAQARVILEKELVDARTGSGYRFIEAITRYDCNSRNATTLKRMFKKNETDIIREEELKGAELPVRSGTLDDKVLREVCRPPKENAAELARKANEAGEQLKQANEAVLKKDASQNGAEEKTAKPGEHTLPPEHAPIPSIRPNLNPVAPESAKPAVAKASEPAKPAEPAKAASELPTLNTRKPTAIVVHSGTAPAKTRKPPRSEGYMLEIAQHEPAEQHRHIHWDYEGDGGPENWARLDPRNQVCATGQRQSPIDIRDGIKVNLESIRFNYRPSTFRIVDNGHTIQVNVGDNSITLTGKTYELVQFHFHRPSEEKINGQRFDMVAHLVHKADDGQLAVVAVLLERGNEHPLIQNLWNNLPLEKNQEVSPPDLAIDLSTLLPENRSYYTYMGSLTTPPCSENVLWLVMKQPVQISGDQIGIFSRLYRNNVRPIQSSAGRLIKESR